MRHLGKFKFDPVKRRFLLIMMKIKKNEDGIMKKDYSDKVRGVQQFLLTVKTNTTIKVCLIWVKH